MKTLTKTAIILTVISSILFFSCKKDEPKPEKKVVIPSVSTDSILTIWSTVVECKATIVVDSNSIVTDYGVCWSTLQNPTVNNTKNNIHNAFNGSYVIRADNLNGNNTYYIRAYATNGAGTAYGQQLTFTTPSETVTDYDGNVYNTLLINRQLWLKENLKVTHYQNGDGIPNVTDATAWDNLTTDAYCNYDNDTAKANKYGRLYNWYVVANSRSVCPVGWHVPTDLEWHTMVKVIDPNAVIVDTIITRDDRIESLIAGAMMKKSGDWGGLGEDATNTSGFTALSTGYRSSDEQSDFILNECYLWSLTSSEITKAYCRNLDSSSPNCLRLTIDKICGCTIRCVHN